MESFVNIVDDEINDNNRNLLKVERTEAGYSLLVKKENIQELKSSFITNFNNTEGYDAIVREIAHGEQLGIRPMMNRRKRDFVISVYFTARTIICMLFNGNDNLYAFQRGR